MLTQEQIDQIAEIIAAKIRSKQTALPEHTQISALGAYGGEHDVVITEDIVSEAVKARAMLENPENPDALARMKRSTNARIGVDRVGPRLNTKTMLTLRADHAQARDSVFADVDAQLLKRLGLFAVRSRCEDKNQYITRPDLGRLLSEESIEVIEQKCVKNPDVQIIAADGLSSAAIEANLENILPVLKEGLEDKGLKVGTPFFVKYGRVGIEDHIAEILGATLVMILIGERPGLATAESMSAYMVYNSHVGIPEAKRTVVSNIHKNGLMAVEAGAYIVDVACEILEKRASGVDLQARR